MSETELPRPPRSPWQLFYGAAHRLRAAWYRRRAQDLPRPVVSVGNLHWGGSGKTPLVAAIAERLRDRGRRVAILSRGYRGRGRGVRVVSVGEGPLLGPSTAGDEPVLLASELPGVAVVVGPDRAEAGRHALERIEPRPDLFLLDDGFSHLALRRDLDLLAVPAADPFGGGRLWPGGRLREPLASSARADAAVVTGEAEGARPAIEEGLRRHGFRGALFSSRTEVGEARSSRGHPLKIAASVFLVSAIARPEAFEASAAACGYRVRGALRFPDHHDYPQRSLARVRDAWRASGADYVLTTGKDRVKLLGRLDAPVAELPLRIEPEPAFWSWLKERLQGLGGGAPTR